jgi:predicted DNA-binding transcriptional regulator AlpA
MLLYFKKSIQRINMKFLRIKHLPEKVALSRSEIWDRVKDNSFPIPISLSSRCTVWDEEEVEDWMKDMKENSRVAI